MPGPLLIHRIAPARSGTEPHPALVLLHGLGDDEAGMFSIATQLDPRVFALSVRAPLSYRWGGYMWFDIEREGPNLGGEGIEASIAALAEFLAAITSTYPIDPARIYLGGFSMGAAMAGAMTLLAPERIAGAVMVSGFLPPDPEGRYRTAEATGKPFFQAHGLHDQVVSLQYARMTREFLRETPVDLTYREYPTGHDVTLPELQELSSWFSSVLDASGPS